MTLPTTLRLVFVCSGNICRSPMAAALAEAMLASRGQRCVIISGGTLEIHGRPAAAHAQQVIREVGLELGTHRSQGIDLGMLGFADAIVVMAPEHKRWLERRAKALGPKVVSLWEHHPVGEAGRELGQIFDPVGGTLEQFRLCREHIEASLKGWFDRFLASPA